MKITIQYFDGCPNWQVAAERVRRTIDEAELGDVDVELHRIADEQEAQGLAFAGSPTILADGVDLFPSGEPARTLACRLYLTESGTEGSPSVAQLRHALGGRV